LDAIVFVKAGSIPKTSSGKVQRHACRKGFLEGTLAAIAQWSAQPLQRQTSLYEQSEGGTPEAVGRGPTEAKSTVQPRPETTVPAESGAEPSGCSDRRVAGNGRAIARQVLEEVARVAKDRASGLTLDTNIVEIGLNSMERMQIVAALEERFGGRFPEDVLPGLDTCRHVVEAVQDYLGKVPSQKAARAAVFEPLEETYQIARFPEYVRLRQNLDLVEATGVGSPFLRDRRSATGKETSGGSGMIDFSSYNYLGLAGSRAVIRAAQEAAGQYGTSVAAAGRFSERRPLHRELEQAIAGLVETDDAVIVDGSRAAAQTVISHLFGSSDLILYDSLAHKSIVQGSILSGARHVPFDHNDWRSLDRLLDESRHRHRRVLVAIEGVSSVSGEVAKLPKFIDVKKRRKALLLVDEAHSIGTLGAHGQGIGEHFGVSREDVDIWAGTLSNALGGTGSYVAGSGALIDYLKYTAPGYVLTAGLSAPGAAAALASIELLSSEPQRVAHLQDRSRQFLARAKDRGLNTGTSEPSPIVPIILGNSMVCLQLSEAMISRGVYVQPMLYPAVAEQDARLRFFLTALHSAEQIEYTLDTLAEELDRIQRGFARRPSRQTDTSARVL
jgi:7-keto-8-aminopelargonate synthetase-like enzyme/acyl carrier protein